MGAVAMSEPERTYTLAEAKAELARQECELAGHRPVVFDYSMTGWCECGQYRWKGEKA